MQMQAFGTALTAVGALGLLSLVGCQQPVDLSKVEDGLAKLEKKQDKILARIDEVGKKVGKAGAPARPQPRPGRPDPNKVYKVEVGDAPIRGPKDALVTIVEWSDFQ